MLCTTSNGMNLDKEQFEFIKPLIWDEVAEIWRNNEINEEHWKTYYGSKGHKSWQEWRKKYIDAYAALNKGWYLVKVKDPLASVPNFRGGNYKGWKDNFYEGKELPTFVEMKEHPAAGEFLKNFPKETTIIALNTDIGIIIAEGMHRCAAITKATKEGKMYGRNAVGYGLTLKKFDTDLYIAMADIKKEEIPDFTKE